MGYFVGAHYEQGTNLKALLYGLLGTAFVSAGAGALNHFLERDSDKKMERTKNRPLPTGAISNEFVICFTFVLISIGLSILLVGVNQLVCLLALFTFCMYWIYTLLKPISWFNTLIGAIPGAITPIAGWASVSGHIGYGALSLFLILFIWQLPHFYAIAWMYKDDYKRGQMKMISVIDEDGSLTSRQVVIQTIILLVVTLIPFSVQLLGWVYLIGALLLGAGFIVQAVKFNRVPTFNSAKRVLLFSIAYLPILLFLIMIDTII